MKIAPLALTAAALAAIVPAAASANPHHHYGYRSHVYVAPYYPRYYIPFSFYYGPYVAAPYYAYAYPPVARPPVVIERRYAEAPPPRMLPTEPQYREGERSYAQAAPVAPPKAETREVVPPAPRVERYTLSATELFEFDKATLRMPQPKLDEIAAALTRSATEQKVTITGYTDRLGSEAYNQKLSQRRADVVKEYLVQKGVDARRLTAIGKGESNPVVQCEETEMTELIKCLEPNRRVEVESITVEVKV